MLSQTCPLGACIRLTVSITIGFSVFEHGLNLNLLNSIAIVKRVESNPNLKKQEF
jgi:hypothetical protein